MRVAGQLTGPIALLDLVLADGAVADFFGAGAGCSKCNGHASMLLWSVLHLEFSMERVALKGRKLSWSNPNRYKITPRHFDLSHQASFVSYESIHKNITRFWIS